MVSASGRTGARKDEIRVEFPRAGREVGVIYYRREHGALVPVSVHVAIP